jgi:cellulose synthase/poly-beta-1,6-N-acetylglucosamine synthase-like glycosyltransferase
MITLAALLVAAPVVLAFYAYVAYPLALRLAATVRSRPVPVPDPEDWPLISIVVIAHNAEHTIRATVERLLSTDYPADRRQMMIVSDASTDGTDSIVGEYAARGVELHRVEPRAGKTVAESSVAHHVRGEIVVNMDASAVVAPGSIRSLVRSFSDPAVGVASGRAVSVPSAPGAALATRGDATYYGYEMWVRSLEMSFGVVIGATGALYAVRRALFVLPLPPHATRDFASPLLAYEHGYRSVIDNRAVCFVRQNPSLRREYHRKLRTMVRGLDTLYEFRHLLDPIRNGRVGIMLASHKLCRWLIYLLLPLGLLGLAILAGESTMARVALAAVGLLVVAGVAALGWPDERRVPAPLALCGYALVGGLAGSSAWSHFLRGQHVVTWEPTRRTSPLTAEAPA